MTRAITLAACSPQEVFCLVSHHSYSISLVPFLKDLWDLAKVPRLVSEHTLGKMLGKGNQISGLLWEGHTLCGFSPFGMWQVRELAGLQGSQGFKELVRVLAVKLWCCPHA